jgi:hypothetical protein
MQQGPWSIGRRASIRATAIRLARTGKYADWRAIEIDLLKSFPEDARLALDDAYTRDQIERACAKARSAE